MIKRRGGERRRKEVGGQMKKAAFFQARMNAKAGLKSSNRRHA
jgi:hypothetical protein